MMSNDTKHTFILSFCTAEGAMYISSLRNKENKSKADRLEWFLHYSKLTRSWWWYLHLCLWPIQGDRIAYESKREMGTNFLKDHLF